MEESQIMIDEILEALNDNKWHSTAKIMQQLKQPIFKTCLILSFLSEYGFVQFLGNEVKVDGKVEKFLRQIKEIERNESKT